MNYQIIDQKNWHRKEYFNHYLTVVPCTYSLSVRLDITKIIQKNSKLYPSILYCLTKVVNKHEQFRTAFRKNKELVIYDQMLPSYTIFHKDHETFSSIWTEYHDNYQLFTQNYQKDNEKFANIHQLFPKPDTPENSFSVSMIPWIAFDAFQLNINNSDDYLLPIFTLGQYQEQQEKFILPLALQVHHSVCDAFHVGRFIHDLQQELDCWNK